MASLTKQLKEMAMKPPQEGTDVPHNQDANNSDLTDVGDNSK